MHVINFLTLIFFFLGKSIICNVTNNLYVVKNFLVHVIGAALKKKLRYKLLLLMLLTIFLQINLISVCNLINMTRVNWGIHLVNNLSTLLSLQISPIWGN